MEDLIIKGLNKSFGDRRVLTDFNAVFKAGTTTSIMGESGCGKTTLINILLGFIKPDAGVISGMPHDVGVVFQEDRLADDFSVISNVELVRQRSDRGRAVEILNALGLGQNLNDKVRSLSGGMKRRVAIARALYYDGDMLILDEGFKGLDEANRAAAIEAVRRFAAGRTIISVTHDPDEPVLLGGELLVMHTLL